MAKPAEPYELNTGVTGGMSADRAVYVQGENVGQHWASAQRVVSLVTWRGRRAQVTLRLKNEGGIGSNLAMVVGNAEPRKAMETVSQSNARGDQAWHLHQFVLDIPKDATGLLVAVGFTGKGKVWMDDLKLAAVGPDIALTPAKPLHDEGGCNVDALCSLRN
ncbi:MAG: hypothetical protein JO256_03335 [Alphaproteobacteria bacterium]|nr:hypothetical protein [Alphaproteobacteria bacterium]